MDDQELKAILLDIHHRLLACYGPQHWWPAREPFEVIVGAILTQSAAWTNVEKAINNLKNAVTLSPEALRHLPDPEMARLVYPCGYYNVKARKLKAFAGWLGERYDDNLDTLFAHDIDSLRRQLLNIYGIGEETADSIILYAANKPSFVIDAYTRRIISRMGLAPRSNSYIAYQALFMANLPADAALFNEYHALLVRLAKDVCRKHPTCRFCCLNPEATNDSDPASGQFPCASVSRHCRQS
jgi:endonuclease-3 related protein